MRTILLALVLSFSAGCSGDKSPPPAAGEHKLAEMTVDEVDKAIAAGEVTAVDCNGDQTRKKLGVLPKAILTSEEDYPESELPTDKMRKLVFYCTDVG